MKRRLEFTILRKTLLAAMVATFMLFLHDWYVSFYTVAAVELATLILIAGLYWLSKKPKNLFVVSHSFILIAFLALNAAFYFNKGLGIGIAVLYTACIALTQVLVFERYRLFATVAIYVNLFILLTIEAINPNFVVFNFYGAALPVVAISKGLILSIGMLFATWVVLTLKKEYDLAYNKIVEQNIALEEINEEIEIINTQLDTKVAERTESLQKQQEKLLKYAFFHSHNVRSPLSNILNINEALELEKLDETKRDELLTILKQEATKLDEEIKTIQNAIQHETAEHEKLSHIESSEK